MNEIAYQKISALASHPEEVEQSVAYLASHLGMFLKRRDKVLILFEEKEAAIGAMMRDAVVRCEGVPMFLGSDQRWLAILKTAFITKCDAIIGPPLTMLGLAKLAKYRGTPLFARNVLVAGYPSVDWMIEGIQQGLDCRVWGCYDPGQSSVIAGFSCGRSRGIHLRREAYQVRLLNSRGEEVQPGENGQVLLQPVRDPRISFCTGDTGRLELAPCSCGCGDPRLMEIDTSHGIDPALSSLGESLLHWSSILDCKLANSGYGLELELVVFPGEKLPKLPNCAKLVVRNWNPETDEPFPHGFVLKKRIFSLDNH